jgi:hypothetical protein
MTTLTNKEDASSLPSDINEVAVCYLCLDGGLDDADQPLRRDCACRGTDAGFVHLACLTKYAESKSTPACRDMIEFVNPWVACPHCHQEYQNELRIDIATKFISSVRRRYPDDTRMQVEALYSKLCALIDMFGRLQPRQKIEAGVAANVMLSLIDRMKADAPPLSRRYSQFEANTLGFHGRIASAEGTKESARRAVTHFEKQLEVFEAVGDDEGITVAKGNIAIAKSKYEGGNNNEEVLKANKELYELRVSEDGDEDEYTIRAGKHYAINLRKANRGDEARELLTKLLATSKQVFGSDHNITKEIESELKQNEAMERVIRFMKQLAELKQVAAEREIVDRG